MYVKISQNFKQFQRTVFKIRNRFFKRYEYSTSASQAISTSNFDCYRVGTNIHGFEVKAIRKVEELQLTAIQLTHRRTGAEYLHVARDDPTNVFSIAFRTTPMDNTGVAHILEHNVLCGSKKYPCRDPFFKMLNRSLASFMNAMTGFDYTVYPFSTQNKVDFRNLMSVYLDAVFKPNLLELDFLQEGWRLEHEDLTDKNSPIIFKGVVFNEMKGSYSDSQQLFAEKLRNGLLPSHTYSFAYGGDPLHIPQLTWENLRTFHTKHYHPSNSRIYSYGDTPLEDHLAFIDQEYLSTFEKISSNTSVPAEPKWNKPLISHIGCNVDPMLPPENQTSLAISYLLTDITNDFENFVLYVIGELLVSGPNAPFYKTLIETSLGTSLAPATGVCGQTKSTTFTIGLQGISNSEIKKTIKAIEDTFEDVTSKGFSTERIDSILHNIELSLKHQTTSFGLGLVLSLCPLWNHDGNVLMTLEINSKINRLRKTLKSDPMFLQRKIRQYFISNNHKYTLTMSPEDQYEQKLSEAEKELLSEKVSHLNDDERESLWRRGHELKLQQEQKHDVSCLPTLHVTDIPRDVPDTPLSNLSVCGNIPLQLCIQPTNGVSYFNAVLSTKKLPENLVEFVPLFCDILTSMGAGDHDFRELNQEIELISGGLTSSLHVTNFPESSSNYEEGIHLSSYCLHKNATKMFNLWTKILNELRLDDVDRFTTLVKMMVTERSNSLAYNGHSYAMTAASQSVNYVGNRKERVGGLTYLKNLKELSNLESLSEALIKLKQISDHLLNKDCLRVAVNTSPDNADDSVKHVEYFLNNVRGTNLNEPSMLSVPSSFTLHTQRIHHVFGFPVNFLAKAYSSVPYAHPDGGPLSVLSRLMFQFLHREIREKGGAYGGGSFSSGGTFGFYSYRDPNTTRTLKTFDEAVDWVLSGEFTQQDIDEAKLGVFQGVDAPVAPGSKGMRQFITHITDDIYRNKRISILNTTSNDLIRVCRDYLKEAPVEGVCLIGQENEDIENDDRDWNKLVY